METIRVILIDDHPIVRSGVRMLLEQAPDIAVIGEADHGNNALDLLRRLQPDVLLLDMEMPGKSGLEVAREVQESGLPVRVLALSAYDDEQYIMNLLSNGAAGYLTKEEALTTIIDAVRGVARGEEGWLSRRAVARVTATTRRPKANAVELTPREGEVVELLVKGWTNQRIANALDLSERTVRFHLSNIYSKANVNSRAEAVSWALTQHEE